MTVPEMEQRPGVESEALSKTLAGVAPIVTASADILGDLDALAEHLRGRLVVQVVVEADHYHRRTNVYRSCPAAERAVGRARLRGQTAHATLVQMLPVGVVVGGAR